METIGDEAFRSCHSLTEITIGDSVTTIKGWAFYDCTGLTEITIPDSVTTIEEYAFYNCDSLTDVYYAGRKDQWNAIDMEYGAFGPTDADIHYNS